MKPPSSRNHKPTIPQQTAPEQEHSGLTEVGRNVLQLLLERKVVELLPERELAVDALLADVEVLHVEEPILADGLDERLRELLLALGRREEAEVESEQRRPVEVLLEDEWIAIVDQPGSG